MVNNEDFDTFEAQYGRVGPYSPKPDRGYHDDYPPLELNDSEPSPVLHFVDYTHRLEEIDLGSFDGSDESVTSKGRRTYSNRYARVAVTGDPRRIAIHALGNYERPAGVDPAAWQRLDLERFEIPRPSFRLRTEPVYEIPENAVYASTVPAIPPPIEPVASEELQKEHDPTEMPFLDHLEEFRWAILKSLIVLGISMILGWFLSDIFFNTINKLATNAGLSLMTYQLLESVMVKLQMALIIGLVVSLPFIFYFIWSFVAPGLYKNEKRWILPMVWGATVCFFAGASLAFFVIIPLLLKFMKTFIPAGIPGMFAIGNFVSTLLKFTLLFGVIFELPMVTFFLAKLGIIKHTWMAAYRKYAIIIIFVLGAIFTPPDPISQVIMAMPLIILYEISIWVARFAGRKTII